MARPEPLAADFAVGGNRKPASRPCPKSSGVSIIIAMKRHLRTRAETLLALVAIVALLVGPAAFANCCCAVLAAAEPADAAAASCCASTAAAPSTACCLPPSSGLHLASGLQGDSAVPGTASDCPRCDGQALPAATGSKLPCQCVEACCETAVNEVTVVRAASDQRADSVEPLALPGTLFAAAPLVSLFPADAFRRDPNLLSAQARCAKLCRWLN